MGLWAKEQLHAFIKENKLVTAQDAQNALKDCAPAAQRRYPHWPSGTFAETIQEMLEAEKFHQTQLDLTNSGIGSIMRLFN